MGAAPLSWQELTEVGTEAGTWLPEVVGPSVVEVPELTFNRLLLTVLACEVTKNEQRLLATSSKVSLLEEQTQKISQMAIMCFSTMMQNK